MSVCVQPKWGTSRGIIQMVILKVAATALQPRHLSPCGHQRISAIFGSKSLDVRDRLIQLRGKLLWSLAPASYVCHGRCYMQHVWSHALNRPPPKISLWRNHKDTNRQDTQTKISSEQNITSSRKAARQKQHLLLFLLSPGTIIRIDCRSRQSSL